MGREIPDGDQILAHQVANLVGLFQIPGLRKDCHPVFVNKDVRFSSRNLKQTLLFSTYFFRRVQPYFSHRIPVPDLA